MSVLLWLAVVLGVLSSVAAQGSWTHPTGSPSLTWSINGSNVIQFTYTVRTRGWMAMGLSPDGTMVGSDIFWGQYDAIGPVIVDRRAFEYAKPPPDASQDLTLIPTLCNFTSTATTLVFTRKLITGDVNDRPIVAGTLNLVWSYSTALAVRPASAGLDFDFSQHNYQGSAQVDFLTPTQTTTLAVTSTTNAATTTVAASTSTSAASTTAITASTAAASTAASTTNAASNAASTSFTSTSASSTTAQAATLGAVSDTTSFTSLAATTTNAATTFGTSTTAASIAATSTTAATSNAATTTAVASAASTASLTTSVLSTSLASMSAATTTAAVTTATARPPTTTGTAAPQPTGAPPSGGTGSFTSPDHMITVSWRITGQVIRFTLSSPAAGWFAVGLSRSGGMLDADIYWAQINAGSGTAVLLDRYTTAHSLPPLDPTQSTTLISGSRSPAGVATVVFERPLVTGDVHDVPITDSAQSLIWAWSSTLGTPVNKRQSGVTDYSFTQHQASGAATVNFATGTAVVVGTRDTLRKLHGILMLCAWGLFQVLGTFIARYLKATLGKWWFYLHISFQLLAIALNFIGFLMIVMQGDSHFDGPHQVIGLIILIFSIVQPVLGLVAHLLFEPNRRGPPFFPDKVHWLVGGLILFMTLAELWLGLSLYCVSIIAVLCFGIYIFVATAIFLNVDRFLSFDLMRWLAPWGDHLRIHEKIHDAPRIVLIIVEIAGAVIVLVTVIVVAFQIWVKDASANSKSFYAACTLGELSGGLHWAWFLGFGGAFVLGCALVAVVAWCITTGLDKKYHSQGDNPYVISL